MTTKKVSASTGRTPAKKPTTTNAPKRKEVVSRAPVAPKATPDVAENAHLLEIDAMNNAKVDLDELDMPAPRHGFMGLSLTPSTAPPRTFGIKWFVSAIAAALIVGLLAGGSQGFSRGHATGWEQGQQAAYLETSIAGMRNYLDCIGDPPACEPQRATAQWTKSFTDSKLAELEPKD